MDKQEFNMRFLWELQRYTPKVARDLLHECCNDVRFRGFEYAQRRWAKFIGLDKKDDACSVCGSSNWWYRQASECGCPGERLCSRCHPKPREKKGESPIELGWASLMVAI